MELKKLGTTIDDSKIKKHILTDIIREVESENKFLFSGMFGGGRNHTAYNAYMDVGAAYCDIGPSGNGMKYTDYTEAPRYSETYTYTEIRRK